MTTRAMQLNPDHPGWYRYFSFFPCLPAGRLREGAGNHGAGQHAQLGHERQAREALEEFLDRIFYIPVEFEELSPDVASPAAYGQSAIYVVTYLHK
jgi:hypothetical protein